MKFKCGESNDQRWRRLKCWHQWFAWFPVRCGDGYCHWLETLWRRGTPKKGATFEWWEWEHRVSIPWSMIGAEDREGL